MPRLTVTGTNIDAPDASALADFYRRLLGWTTRTEEPGWVVIQQGASDEARGGTVSFQTESSYVRPVWQTGPGDAHAVAQGASLAGFPPEEDVRVWHDPAGHPFRLDLG